MGVIYRSEFKSNIGITWRIDLHNVDYSGSASTFTVAGEGFTLERNATNGDPTDAVLGSQLTVHALAETSAFDNYLRGLVNDAEDRNFVVIYKDTVKWWAGVLLMDMYEEVDAPRPRAVDLRFTDGLARLKEIEYTDAGTRFTGTDTVIGHIWNVLALNPVTQFWSGTGDTALRTSVHYWEDQMSYSNSSDPLPDIRVPHASFWEEKENGDYDIKSAYEVLVQLVTAFYARFWLGDGAYHLVQVDEMGRNLLRVFEYDKNATSASGWEDVEIRVPLDQEKNGLVKVAGMRRMYYPALRKVTKKYLHQTSGNFLPSPLVINAAARTIADVDDGGGDARLSVQGAIRLSITNDIPSTGVIFVVRVRFKIKQGTRYLKRAITSAGSNTDYSAMAWTVTNTDTVEYYTGGIVKATTTGREVHTRSIQVDFATPTLLNDGAVEVELISVAADVIDPAGGTVANVSVSGEFDGYIEYTTPDGAENERYFSASNVVMAANSRILALEDALFGDEINSSTKNAIEVWDGSAWARSAGWTKRNSGTPVALYQLVTREVIANRLENVQRILIDLRGDFSFLNVMYQNPDVFVPLSGSFLANSAMWRGMEMFLHTYETAQVTTVGEAAPIDRNLIQPPSVNFNAGGIPIDETVRLSIGSVNPSDTLGNVTVGPPVTGITGTNNLLLGGGSNLTSGSNNILIGVDASSPTVSNELNIGDVIRGDLSAGTVQLPNLGTGTDAGIVAYDANNQLIKSSFLQKDGALLKVEGYGIGNNLGSESTFPAFDSTGVIRESRLITTDGSNIIVNGNLNITEGNAYLYDGVQALRLSKGTDTYYANTQAGYLAGDASARRQTAFGSFAGFQTLTNDQVAFGFWAGRQSTGNSQSVFGSAAGYLSTGANQSAFGLWAGRQNAGANQSAFAFNAGYLNIGANQSVFGFRAGFSNSGNNQSAFGSDAGFSNTGDNQSAFGYQAGYENEGDNTVFLGYQAGRGNTTDNIFILKQNNVNTTSLIEGDFLSGQVAFRNYGTGTITGTESTFMAFQADGKLIEYTLQDFFALVPEYATNVAAAVDLAVGETYYNNLLNTYTRVT